MKKFFLILSFIIVTISTTFGMRNDLEKKVSEDIRLKTPERDQFMDTYQGTRVMSPREHFTRNLVSISYRPYAQTINYTEDATNGNFDLSASAGMSATIEWSHNSFNRIQLLTGIDLSLMDYKDDATLKSKGLSFLSDKLFGFYAGVRYYLSERINLYTKFSLSQTHYVNFKSSAPELSRFTVPKFYLGMEALLYRSSSWKFAIDSRFLGLTNLSKSLGELEVSQGFGYYADLALKYWVTSGSWMRLSFSMESLATEVKGTSYTGKQASATPGIGAEFGLRF